MRVRCSSLLPLVICTAVACSGSDDTATPVAEPSLTLSRPRAALGSPIDGTFRFTLAPGAKIDGDYRVLVHFLDAGGEMMWADDHDPPVPTSQWKPGETVEYTRTMFIPVYNYVGPATVHVGLYSPRDHSRLPLAGPTEGQREYALASLELLPQSENIFILFKDGWHAQESSAENSAITWQWTTKNATISFRNPRKPITFYLHADNPGSYAETQPVELLVNGTAVDQFEVAPRAEVVHRTALGAEQLGTSDMVDLTIRVGKTWVPALLPASGNNDYRELGLRVFHAYVEPRG